MSGGRLHRAVSAALGFVLLIALWWAATDLLGTRPVILPAPEAVAKALLALAADPSFHHDIATSLVELAGGLALGTILGVAIGVALARSPVLGAFLEPMVETFRFIVPFSLVPLVVVWFGVAPIGKIFVVAYACVFVMALSTAAAITEIDPLLLKAAAMLRLRGWRLLRRVILPAAMPRLLTGFQLAIAAAWVAVVAAEYVGAQAGLGMFIVTAQSGLETTQVIAGMAVIGIIGLALSLAVSALRRLLIPHEAEGGW